MDIKENCTESRSLLHASQKGHYDEVKLLLESGQDVNTSDYNGDTALLEASLNGHCDVVRLLLEKGADVNLAAPDGKTALVQACYLGYIGTAKVLLDFEANVNSTENKYGCSSLVFASQNGHGDVVKLLVERGANVNLATASGWTALMLASKHGHYGIVKLLLEVGAELNSLQCVGTTALIQATLGGHCHVVRMLLEKGAEVNIATVPEGKTALTIACWLGHTNIVEMLLKFKAAVNLTEMSGLSSLIIASDRGHGNVVKLLLEKGAEVNLARLDRGVTALRQASQNGHYDVVKVLLNWGAEVNFLDQDKATALITASHCGHCDVAKALLAKGADVNAARLSGSTALMEASSQGHIDTVRLLLHYNAGINTTNNYGWSSLVAASHSGHYEIVEVLLERGAQVNLANQEGLTALMAASQNGHYGAVWLLLERGAEVDSSAHYTVSPLALASQNGHCEVVRLLLEKGAKVNLITGNIDTKTTALLGASIYGHHDVVRLLLETGAEVNAAVQGGVTSLMHASARGYTKTVQVLLGFKASTNATHPGGWNSLLYASQNGHCHIVRLLLENGADPNFATRDYGLTPLIQASRNGHCDVANVLLNSDADINLASNSRYSSKTALMMASHAGHWKMARVLLEGGAKVNIVSRENGESALIIASLNGFYDVVRLLIEWGADVNAALPESGADALIQACSKSHADIAKLLLSKGADATLVAYDGKTALLEASQNGLYDLVRLLLDRGANINIVTYKTGRTALTQASQNGHCGIVRLLLERGAGVNLVTFESDTTAICLACQLGHYDIIKVLLEWGADTNLSPGKDGTTALMLASKYDRIDAVRLLLESGADVNAVTNDMGVSALMTASKNGCYTVAKLLLEKGADVNLTATDGGCALMQASLMGHYDVVKLLLEREANVNITTRLSDASALFVASAAGHHHIVRLLLEKGAEVNSSTDDGTALTQASQYGHTKVVRLLLEFGADVNASSVVGETALTRSASSGHWDIVNLLTDAGGNLCHTNSTGESAAMYIAFAESSGISDIKLGKRRKIREGTSHESDYAMSVASFALAGALMHDTPVYGDMKHMFTNTSHFNIGLYAYLPKCLNQYGRENDCLLTPYQGVEGKISLHTLGTAVLCKQSDSVLKWLTAKYRDNFVNMLGQSPLHLLAMENHFLGHMRETVFCLRQMLGFSLSEKDNNGRVPYHIACMWLNSQFLLCGLSLDFNFEANMLVRDHIGYTPLEYMAFVVASDIYPTGIPFLKLLCARKVLVLLSQLLGKDVSTTKGEGKNSPTAQRDIAWSLEKCFYANMDADQLDALTDKLKDHSLNGEMPHHSLNAENIALLFKDNRKGVANMKQKQHLVVAIIEILYLIGAEMGNTDSLFECVPYLKGSVQEYTKCGKFDEIDTSMLLVNFADHFKTHLQRSNNSLSASVVSECGRYWESGNPELLSSVAFCADFWQLFVKALDTEAVRESLRLNRIIIENLKRKHGFVGILNVSFQGGDNIQFMSVDIAPSIVSGNFDGYTALLRPRHHDNKQVGKELQRGFELSSSHKDWDFLKFLPSEVMCGYSLVKMLRSLGTTFQTKSRHIYMPQEILSSYMIKMALLWVLDPENKFKTTYRQLDPEVILGDESSYDGYIRGSVEHVLCDILGRTKRAYMENDHIKHLLEISEKIETGSTDLKAREIILPYVLVTKCPGRKVQNGIDLESMAENWEYVQDGDEIIYSRTFYTEYKQDKHKCRQTVRPISHHTISYPVISEETAKKCLLWARRILRLLPHLLRYSELTEGEVLNGVRNYYLPEQEVYTRDKDLAIALCGVLEALLLAD